MLNYVTSSICIAAIASNFLLPARSETFTLIAQAKVSPRISLAQEIQKVAYQFANTPDDYSLVSKTEELTWKMILMSEGLSSCAIPAYSLPFRMENINTSYVMMINNLNALGNVSESLRDQNRASFESNINGSKKAAGKVLEQVLKYCK